MRHQCAVSDDVFMRQLSRGFSTRILNVHRSNRAFYVFTVVSEKCKRIKAWARLRETKRAMLPAVWFRRFPNVTCVLNFNWCIQFPIVSTRQQNAVNRKKKDSRLNLCGDASGAAGQGG